MKATRLLVSGRVIIDHVTAGSVHALVRGEAAMHEVTLSAGMWACSCPHRGPNCSHALAVRRVVAVVE